MHTGSARSGLAEHQQARAVADGTDIYFAAGQYRPGTRAGDALIAHELRTSARRCAAYLAARPLATVGAERDAMEADADSVAQQVADEVDTEHRASRPSRRSPRSQPDRGAGHVSGRSAGRRCCPAGRRAAGAGGRSGPR